MNVLAAVRNLDYRFRNLVSDHFSITSMKSAASCCSPILQEQCPEFAWDENSRVIIDGSPAFIFRWLLRLDGVVARTLFVPRAADSSVLEALEAHADCVLMEQPQAVVRWRTLPVLYGSSQVNEDDVFNLRRHLGDAAGRDLQETQWVLATSGTTGDAKLVAHRFETIARTANADNRYCRFRWGLIYDVARFAGLQVLIQTAVSGSVLLAVDLDQSIQQQVDWLINRECNALSATPTRWRQLLMTDRFGDMPLRQITLGGEIADEGLLNALAQRFPAAQISHVYASTEGGVAFSVHDRKPGFPESLLENDGRSLRMAVGSDGTLWVWGKNYDTLHSKRNESDSLAKQTQMDSLASTDRPALIEKSSLHSASLLFNRQASEAAGTEADFRWINTGDKVEVVGERVFFLGRADGAINVGGIKVFPERVESVVRQVGGVTAVVVRGRASSIIGNLVEAYVTLDHSVPNEASAIASIRLHCRARLSLHERPAFIHIVKELPITESGKISRVSP